MPGPASPAFHIPFSLTLFVTLFSISRLLIIFTSSQCVILITCLSDISIFTFAASSKPTRAPLLKNRVPRILTHVFEILLKPLHLSDIDLTFRARLISP